MPEPTATNHAQQIYDHLGAQSGRVARPAPPPRLVAQSWLRCASNYGIDPVRLHAPTVVDRTAIKELSTRHDELIHAARAEMDALSEQISGSGYALILTDANGVILSEKSDPTLQRQFSAAGLVVGADWSERSEGTNGIGTCIAENRPVTIHRNDHFRARHIGLSCTGAPIRDVTGELLAVLDASCVGSHDTRASQMHTMALVNMSARSIEKFLFLRRYRDHRLVRFHSRAEFVNLMHDGAIALDADDRILAMDDVAAVLLAGIAREELVGRPFHTIFDVAPGLLSSLHAAAPALWPLRDIAHGRRYYASVHLPRTGSSLIQHMPVMDAPRPLPASAEPLLTVIPKAEVDEPLTLEALAGADPIMRRNAHRARRIVDAQVSILIQGPTGSGKEAFARALHLASERAARPFVAVNCAAIPETLIESELFGYRPGAFTGARRDGSRGRIQQSSGGTLFLDEIGDMPLQLQTRLLRVLEEREVTPLGGEQTVRVDLNVVAASHRNLRDLIEHGEFREDLYYRLNGITMSLPSLRERSDVDALVRQVIEAEYRGKGPLRVERAAFERLCAHDWPGNVRELRNVLRTALAICENDLLRLTDLPDELLNPRPRSVASPAALAAPQSQAALTDASMLDDGGSANPLQAAERAALIREIEARHWNMTAVARALGFSRNTLYRKLHQHQIPIQRKR